MKLRKIVEATPALREIANQRLPMKTLYKVTCLIREVQPHKFNSAMTELLDIDVDVNIEPVLIPVSEAENLKLSYNDICAMEGFIEIEFDNKEE